MSNAGFGIIEVGDGGGSIDIGPIAPFDSLDPSLDVFSPVADIFAGAPASSPSSPSFFPNTTIDLSKSVNWQALIASVDIKDLKEKLNSSTSYTVTDPKSGVSVQFLGTGFTSEKFKAYTVLATGTITGFNISHNGVAIASGSSYDISTSTLLAVLLACLEEKSAKPIVDMFFSVPVVVSGSDAVIKSSLSFLEPYKNIAFVTPTDHGQFFVTVAQFDKGDAVLRRVDDGIEIKDTVANVQAALIVENSPLAAEAAINAVYLVNGATALLKLTAAEAAADANVLTRIEEDGDAIVAIKAASGDWTTTGYGDGLKIKDIAGVDAITADGKSEHFVFAAHWGQATISGFDTHYSGAGHDIVTLAKAEFALGAQSLLADAQVTSGSVEVIAGKDTLTFNGLTTIAELKTAIAAHDFKFV